MFRVRCFSNFAELSPRHLSLLEHGDRFDLFTDPAWFAHLMHREFPESDQLQIFSVENIKTGEPLLLAPLRASRLDGAVLGARVLGSISHRENYAPAAFLFAEGAENAFDRRSLLLSLFGFLRSNDGWPDDHPVEVLRLWPFDASSRLKADVYDALRSAGFWVQDYTNSFNRFENTAGLTYDAYFAARSASQRYAVRRKQRALERSGKVEFSIYRDTRDLDAAMAEYAAISFASWKAPATMVSPATLELADLAARRGCIRLGIARLDNRPIAAQLWIVSAGIAHCARLAYREDSQDLAPGVVLTNWMVQKLLDEDRVDRLDFGYGPEEYKGDWMKQTRDYLGLMAFNPATRSGLSHGAKQLVGRSIKQLARRILRRPLSKSD